MMLNKHLFFKYLVSYPNFWPKTTLTRVIWPEKSPTFQTKFRQRGILKYLIFLFQYRPSSLIFLIFSFKFPSFTQFSNFNFNFNFLYFFHFYFGLSRNTDFFLVIILFYFILFYCPSLINPKVRPNPKRVPIQKLASRAPSAASLREHLQEQISFPPLQATGFQLVETNPNLTL